MTTRYHYLPIYLFFLLSNATQAQNEMYNHPGSSGVIGITCNYFRTKDDFLKNTNKDSALFDIQTVSELNFDIRTFLDKPKQWEINDFYCVITPWDTLYNLRADDLGIGYSKRITMDSFHIFFRSRKENSYLIGYGAIGGVLGAALVSAIGPSNPDLTTYITMAVNQNTQKVLQISKRNLKFNLKRLKDEEILKAFNAEKVYSLEVMLKYFKLYMQHKIEFTDD